MQGKIEKFGDYFNMSKKQSHYIHLDLILLLLAFFVVSVVTIYNAQMVGQYKENFVVKQVVYYGLGLAVIGVIQFIDLEKIYKSAIYIHIMGTLSLVALHFTPVKYAKPINGAKSWFNENFPGPTIQPAEFVKITLIIILAAIIVHHKKKHDAKGNMLFDFWLVAKLIAVTAAPVVFIYGQPDLGTSIVFFFITGVMIVLSGINWRVLGLLVMVGVLVGGGLLLFVINFPAVSEEVLGIKPHQVKRILTWYDAGEQVKDDTYHIDLSLHTIGSGQLTGKGIGKPDLFLPEAHTDFIFSIIGERFGFIGAAAVIFLFFLLIYRLVIIGMKVHDDNPFGAHLCFGLMALILIHTFQNIGMTIGIMPITGIPLLFISYGGSTTLSTLIGFGLVYRVAIEHSKERDYLFK